LYGFKGWDKYILTEDEMLQNYLKYLLESVSINNLKYKIIYIAGGNNVLNLMQRNSSEEFFALSQNVISVLDGDYRNHNLCKNNNNVLYIPFESIEKDLMGHYEKNEFEFTVNIPDNVNKSHK